MTEYHDLRFDSRAVSWGEHLDGSGVGDVDSPIHLTSTFAVPGLDPDFELDGADPEAGEFLSGRLSNPTRHALEKRLAALEGGAHGLAFSSGKAAISTLLLGTLSPGDHVAFDDLYAGTTRMLEWLFRDRLGVDVSFVDATDAENVADVARAGDALLGVDNTFYSPALQNPLDLGADVAAHSTTKYLTGHSDSIGGALVLDDPDLAEDLFFLQRVVLGNQMAPFDASLTLRGTKPSRCGCAHTRRTRRPSRSTSTTTTSSSGCSTPAWTATPSTTWRPASSRASAGCSASNSRARWPTRKRSWRRCAPSPSPSPWAAWSRWSNFRRG